MYPVEMLLCCRNTVR